jgi:RNA polymerase sigma-70 factor (ECF subfamily)
LDDYGRVLRDAVARVCRGPLGLQREEIEQEARIRLWRAIRRETNIVDLRLYLHRIVATAAIDAMRQIRGRREIPLEPSNADEQPSSLDHISEDPSPERVVAGRELARTARTLLARLPANRRRAVGLHLQGFTTAEIARLMRWSEPKARNLVHRGLNDLRQQLRASLSDDSAFDLGPVRPDEVRR